MSFCSVDSYDYEVNWNLEITEVVCDDVWALGLWEERVDFWESGLFTPSRKPSA